jgi:two-component system, cell cycle response regulator CpdR
MKLRVLIVDDDDNTRMVIGRLLSRKGHTVDDCASAASALEHMRAAHYDVLETDLVMPVMNGVELTKAARELQPGVRCVITSGYRRTEGVPEEVAWLRKPIDIEQLATLVVG